MEQICPLCGAPTELESNEVIGNPKGGRKHRRIKVKCTECNWGSTRVT
jgi:endogenous inhibitor of DNA gyrase (YacG/DUF329 family)